MTSAAVGVVLATVLLTGRLEEIRDERAHVEQRLKAQEAALGLLQDEKVSVLEVLEIYQSLAHRAEVRSHFMARELKVLQAHLNLAEQEEAVAREALEDELARVGPRLVQMYRLTRRSPLDVLLPAHDLSAAMWRSHAYGAVMKEDLRALKGVRELSSFQQEALAQLDELKATLGERSLALKEELVAAQEQRSDLTDVLTLIEAKASHSGRIAKELKASDEKLGRMISDLEQSPVERGFGALKGKLRLPVRGTVEVGYGNVVNPKFNTVTVQKGLDIRAGRGSEVRAVAAGKVVYAAVMHGYGNLLIVDHGGGYHTLMAHLADFAKQVGDSVEEGMVLGRVGDSGSLKGAYLYFELRQRGLTVDPSPWMSNEPSP